MGIVQFEIESYKDTEDEGMRDIIQVWDKWMIDKISI